MDKKLSISYLFNVTEEKDFLNLANAFVHVIKAVENQGYSVSYHGETLNHPGRIGVIGRPGCGKSHFISEAANQYFSGNTEISEQLHPSHDKKRDVKLWKRWRLNDESREIRLQDDQALSALIGTSAAVEFDDDNYRGVNIIEHPATPEEYCDAIVKFSYDEQGQRIMELKVSDKVAADNVFLNRFLPVVNELS